MGLEFVCSADVPTADTTQYMLHSLSCLLQAGEVFLDCHSTVVVGRALRLPSL